MKIKILSFKVVESISIVFRTDQTLYFIGRVKKNVVPPPEVSENPIFQRAFCQFFCDTKSQPKMSFIRARFISTVETIKDKRFIFFSNSAPMIYNQESKLF